MDINSVVKKYVELRDEKTVLAEKQKEDMRPINEKMDVIEQWLMGQMNEMGVDSLKTPSGIPYKATTKSVKMQDAEAFKAFVFRPVIDALNNYDPTLGFPDIMSLLQGGVRWDMIDFRAGKKGICEHIEETGEVPPGVSVEQFQQINIRRS